MSGTQKLQFYASAPDTCVYLPAEENVNAFADPALKMSNSIYARLIDLGFRRSGAHVYRPICPACQACVSTRLPVAEFRPNRSQRRNRMRNLGLRVSVEEAEYTDEYFSLYKAYLAARHPGGGMDEPEPDSFISFLTSAWSDTVFVEMRSGDTLVAVSVCDVLPQGLSAVYTFFDAARLGDGLGTYAILWLIEEAQRRGLPYIYLGYWIDQHPKMQYKITFRPIEVLVQQRWRRLTDNTATSI